MATNEAFFDQADADKSKSLTIQELKKRLPNSGIDDATIVNIFMDIDKDSDRRVTKAEFLTASSRLLQLRFYEAKQQNAFKDNDRDDSGTLDASELKRALSSSGTKITDFTAERIIRKADRDGDDKVNVNEFLAHYSSYLPLAQWQLDLQASSKSM